MLENRAVGAFENYEVTDAALRELHDSGFPMNHISVVGCDVHQHPGVAGVHMTEQMVNMENLDPNSTKAEEGAMTGTVAGGAVGGLAGLLVGLGVVAIPGVGPVMLAGAAATTIATAIAGGAIGAATGSLAGGLIGLGIPADHAKAYSDRVSRGEYLVVVEGSASDITLAALIFDKHNIRDWYPYDLSV